jgi:18S rRNA (guanine1575-N7)-methyltransferase
VIKIELAMSDRAVQLLCLSGDEPSHILDLGCGSGLSGVILTAQGHIWTGVDISSAMLRILLFKAMYIMQLVTSICLSEIAKKRKVEGEMVLGDLGQGLPFRPGAFDGAISISALQWLCNADKASHNSAKRLQNLFSSLYSCLVYKFLRLTI